MIQIVCVHGCKGPTTLAVQGHYFQHPFPKHADNTQLGKGAETKLGRHAPNTLSDIYSSPRPSVLVHQEPYAEIG